MKKKQQQKTSPKNIPPSFNGHVQRAMFNGPRASPQKNVRVGATQVMGSSNVTASGSLTLKSPGDLNDGKKRQAEGSNLPIIGKMLVYKVYMGLIIKGTIPRVPAFSLW